MIHQHIFASPKPGMSEAEFQDYWINVHAVKYAGKIKQIRKYMIDARIECEGQTAPPLWSGIAEIWINNEEEQLASLQSEEFLQGARLDEPNWAAFWNTQVLDTDAHTIVEGPALAAESPYVKKVVLIKRKEGMPLETFRAYGLGTHMELARALPGLERCLFCTTRDGWYVVGEPRFDAVVQLCFANRPALEAALASPQYKALTLDGAQFVEPRYVFSMICKEHWVIGPEPRH